VERNSLDVTAAVKIIDESGATSVIMGSVYGASSALVKALRAKGKLLFFASASFIGTSSVFDALGNDASGVGISQVMPNPFSNSTQLQREYHAAMVAKQNSPLSYGSIEGYIATQVLAEGIKRSGRALTREHFVSELQKLSTLDMHWFSVSFSPDNHNGSRFTEMTVLGANRKLLH
jgi:branched-chain amino acid transport system substrate-binding protein